MEDWLKISLSLSVFGFLKEFRPSEPFIFEFFTGPWKNLTTEQINQLVFPIGTYSYLAFLIIIFLITDFCRYKPLIVLLGVCGIIVWSLFLWTSTLIGLQIAEVFYGLANASEVAYYTYMYAKVNKEHYQQVTSHARASTLIGRFLAAVISQLGISLGFMDYRDLNYLSLTALTLSAIWGLTLPSVPKSIYFNQVSENNQERTTCFQAFTLLWQHFTTSYSSYHVLKWSFWWALATCGYTQVCAYMQVFWGDIVGENDHQIYNGGVEALLTILSATAALVAGILTVNWTKYGELTLGLCTMLAGSILLCATIYKEIFVSYVAYVVFGTLYQFLITVATSEVAKKLMDDSYGLVFGINTFFALSLQSILTFTVISETGFQLHIYNQYLVYSGLHIFLGAFFVIIGLFSLFGHKKQKLEVNLQ
ncbi:thiamine transporter 1 [Chrysoperla carnea]|uniref:thiamine transporter 1 n=1 Tax=Chrysoperla carnea TaxID=189513 RepID=UPI001D0747B0|nr:thiamine transporter 1 [Chrysoperla carnea]